MSNENLKNILNAPDKQMLNTTNFLARLFRVVLYDLDIDSQTFHMLLADYVKKENAQKVAAAEKSSLKTNLVAFFVKPKMTNKTFERFIKMLNPRKVKFTVTFTWLDGSETSHDVGLDVIGSSIGNIIPGERLDVDDNDEEYDD